ncbi:MAG TPA: Gfo/Idh/MocA family oxidoreductase [Caulobacteraceae bacterium]|jgi:predicted dehydrogenase
MGVLRAGVIGAGVFGGYHAGKYATLPGVEFVGVYDTHAERAEALAGKHGTRGFSHIKDFFEGLDVVTIAAPAVTHATLADTALGLHVHAYVEKPLALSLGGGRKMVQMAEQGALTLAAGHQERAIFAAMGLLDIPEPPVRIEAVRRSSYYPGRGTDVSCVLDMMIHDFDLALALNPNPPAELKATGRTEHGPHLDEVFTEVLFADGMVLTVDGSRLDEGRKRTMRIVYPAGEVTIDFMARTFANTTPYRLNPDYADTPEGKDPLGTSVAAFLAAVRGEADRPLVTGEEALEALELALMVEAQAR